MTDKTAEELHSRIENALMVVYSTDCASDMLSDISCEEAVEIVDNALADVHEALLGDADNVPAVRKATRTLEVTGEVELDKRQKLPGVVVRSSCPVCAQLHEYDLDAPGGHLSYPTVNGETLVYFYCEHEEEADTEWQVKASVRMQLEVIGDHIDCRRV